jgi:hypothetical protein
MLYVVTLTHPPELCLARKEFAPEFMRWYNGMNDLAKKLNIKIQGAYTCPNEHTVYFILESENYKSITGFFTGVMLTNHMARITPVITLKESVEIISQGT